MVSRLYPRPSDPVLGVFVEEETKALSRHCQLRVVSPVPWFPPLRFSKKWYAYTKVPDHETRKGIEVFRPRTLFLPRNLLFPMLGFSFYFSLRRCATHIASDLPFDLIHAHTAYPDGFAAVLVARAMGCPVVITLHGGDVTVHFKHPLVRRLGLWALAHASWVIAVSDALRCQVIDEYGAKAEQITVIPNGVDVDRFKPMPKREASHRLGLEHDIHRILYVGGMERSKGIDYLLKAANMLAKALDRPVQTVFVGDGGHNREAKLLASQLGISDSTTFAGRRPNEEIPLWMNACDVLVLPSLSEGFGVVLIEAMACGKPVVATECGGPQEIVTPGTGLLVPPADEVALSRALYDVLSGDRGFDPQRIRHYTVERYSYEKVALGVLQTYQRAAGILQPDPGHTHRSL